MSTPAMVPMALDVLLSNNTLMTRDEALFRTWKFSYDLLGDDTFHSPEAQAFDADITGIMQTGAWLHWTLPRALRSGSMDNGTDFPLVPNRWLIVRVHRDTQGNNISKAWVQESDCPNSSTKTSSSYMITKEVRDYYKNSADPNRNHHPFSSLSDDAANNCYTANMGFQSDLSAWSEKAADFQFLTAVAPGNVDSSGYIYNNLGIFSFHDDLTDAPSQTTLSYFVCGWYSNAGSEIIKVNGFTGGTTIGDVLASLNWTIANNDAPGAIDSTFYTGMSFGLNWDNTSGSSVPLPDELEANNYAEHMRVTIANNSIDAFSTLIGTQLQGAEYRNVVELLRAFQYDMLPQMNEPDGAAAVKERIRNEWFNSKFGGTRWEIVPDSNNSGQQQDGTLTDTEKTWLSQLNINQRQLDKALEKLYSLQFNLNAAWWKYGYMNAVSQQMANNNTGITADQIKPHLDPTTSDGELRKVLDQLAVVNGLLSTVPQPATDPGLSPEDAYNLGVQRFAVNHVGTGKILKSVNMPRYWLAANPSVLVSGVAPDPLADPDTSIEIRLSSHLINSIKLGGHQFNLQDLTFMMPALSNMSAVPAAIQPLYQEFFLLDPANAGLLAGKAGISSDEAKQEMSSHNSSVYTQGVLPDILLDMWMQKWNPMYIEYEIKYLPVPFEYKVQNTTYRNWTFNGTDYDMKANLQGLNAGSSVKGRSLLSPHAQFTFGARLKAFIDQYGDQGGPFSDIYNQINDIDKWRFLTQELVDFNEYLLQRDKRAYRRPSFETFSYNSATLTFAKVIGYPDTTSNPPYDTPSYGQGAVNSFPDVKIGGVSDFPFHAIRSGQCYFYQLTVFDKFGRILELIMPQGAGVHNYNSYPMVVDDALAVNNKLSADSSVESPWQLPPRLLQPSRLNMEWVDYKNDTAVLNLAADVNPVCGWILSNHLDKSVMVFLPDGTNAGEIALRQNGQTAVPSYIAPPHNDISSVDQITAASSHLGAFISAMLTKTADEFRVFINAIDATLWTTDPLGNRTDQNLSLLIGRPLALARASLQFELDGLPITSCDWPAPVSAAPVDPNIPDFTTSPFSIRLGDQGSPADGVIGYFEDQQYDQFNCVVAPEESQSYVKQIGPLQQADGNYLQLAFNSPVKYITLLVDPRASIHAFTGILPIKELIVPTQFVDTPLSSMEVTFTVGPLLTRLGPNKDAQTVTVLAIGINHLPIAENNGVWSWWEKSLAGGTSWQGYGLNVAPVNAQISLTPPVIREGLLQFVTNLSTDKQ
ncbi:hypothetical protein CLV59_103657 [Chitinophaga dinghuensis]|uniref:Uncharacterized protein n=1 Tax=Chitinophaga dinghuensis TaxID=1539050 RepID=A0A327W687_9BACT|nr:hypothetical protein [Chitinophaga dinghuensis]RAJ83685.1 hypothetical protein CLV59_103657 [Chitinophaga dinghuensis]